METYKISNDELKILSDLRNKQHSSDDLDISYITFSPETKLKLNRLSVLQTKVSPLNADEAFEYQQLSLFIQENNLYGVDTYSSEIEKRIADLAKKVLQ